MGEAVRRELDAYFTPDDASQVMVDRVNPYGCVFEPCVGDGHIARMLGCRATRVLTNDLDPKRSAMTHFDARDARAWRGFVKEHGPIDWVVSNPPFKDAVRIVQNACQFARVGVVMLLRLSFLEPCEDRGEWLERNPPTTQIVVPRISFTGDGRTDSVTCAWFVWMRTEGAVGTISVVSKRRLGGDHAPSLLESEDTSLIPLEAQK